MAQQRDAAILERDAARAATATAVADRDAARRERDNAAKERDTAVRERDTARSSMKAALSERDTTIKKWDTAVNERDTARRERGAALQERDAARREREAAEATLALRSAVTPDMVEQYDRIKERLRRLYLGTQVGQEWEQKQENELENINRAFTNNHRSMASSLYCP